MFISALPECKGSNLVHFDPCYLLCDWHSTWHLVDTQISVEGRKRGMESCCTSSVSLHVDKAPSLEFLNIGSDSVQQWHYTELRRMMHLVRSPLHVTCLCVCTQCICVLSLEDSPTHICMISGKGSCQIPVCSLPTLRICRHNE